MTIYQVISQHQSNYPNPIKLTKGQHILVGKAYSGEEDWPNWVYCKTLDAKPLEGWVPEQLIAVSPEGSRGTVIDDYSAQELNIRPGEQLTVLRQLNGWAWCEHSSHGGAGWVPLMCIEPVTSARQPGTGRL